MHFEFSPINSSFSLDSRKFQSIHETRNQPHQQESVSRWLIVFVRQLTVRFCTDISSSIGVASLLQSAQSWSTVMKDQDAERRSKDEWQTVRIHLSIHESIENYRYSIYIISVLTRGSLVYRGYGLRRRCLRNLEIVGREAKRHVESGSKIFLIKPRLRSFANPEDTTAGTNETATNLLPLPGRSSFACPLESCGNLTSTASRVFSSSLYRWYT